MLFYILLSYGSIVDSLKEKYDIEQVDTNNGLNKSNLAGKTKVVLCGNKNINELGQNLNCLGDLDDSSEEKNENKNKTFSNKSPKK